MSKTKLERLLTPVGEAKWAHVHTPKKAFDDRAEPKFQIDVVFDPKDPAWQSFGKDVQARVKACGGKNSPLKPEVEGEDDKPTGRWYCTFKTGAKFAPGVFDRFGKPIPPDVLVGNGSKVRVSYSPKPYEGFDGGLTMYLNAVQVLELVEYKPKSAQNYGFETEQEPSSAPSEEENPFNAPSQPEDGVPWHTEGKDAPTTPAQPQEQDGASTGKAGTYKYHQYSPEKPLVIPFKDHNGVVPVLECAYGKNKGVKWADMKNAQLYWYWDKAHEGLNGQYHRQSVAQLMGIQDALFALNHKPHVYFGKESEK